MYHVQFIIDTSSMFLKHHFCICSLPSLYRLLRQLQRAARSSPRRILSHLSCLPSATPWTTRPTPAAGPQARPRKPTSLQPRRAKPTFGWKPTIRTSPTTRCAKTNPTRSNGWRWTSTRNTSPKSTSRPMGCRRWSFMTMWRRARWTTPSLWTYSRRRWPTSLRSWKVQRIAQQGWRHSRRSLRTPHQGWRLTARSSLSTTMRKSSPVRERTSWTRRGFRRSLEGTFSRTTSSILRRFAGPRKTWRRGWRWTLPLWAGGRHWWGRRRRGRWSGTDI